MRWRGPSLTLTLALTLTLTLTRTRTLTLTLTLTLTCCALKCGWRGTGGRERVGKIIVSSACGAVHVIAPVWWTVARTVAAPNLHLASPKSSNAVPTRRTVTLPAMSPPLGLIWTKDTPRPRLASVP